MSFSQQPSLPSNVLTSALKPKAAEHFPDSTDNYNKTIVTPCSDAGGAVVSYECVLPPEVPAQAENASDTPSEPVAGEDGLTGQLGYISPMLNCVDFARSMGKSQMDNPISWLPTTQTPFIGAAALFPYNHVGIVVGIWSDGDVEIAHANCPGCATRYSRSEFRGFF